MLIRKWKIMVGNWERMVYSHLRILTSIFQIMVITDLKLMYKSQLMREFAETRISLVGSEPALDSLTNPRCP